MYFFGLEIGIQNKVNQKVKYMVHGELIDELKPIIEKYGAKGGILILDTDDSNKIAVHKLSTEKVRENLCLAIHYNERVNEDIEQ